MKFFLFYTISLLVIIPNLSFAENHDRGITIVKTGKPKQRPVATASSLRTMYQIICRVGHYPDGSYSCPSTVDEGENNAKEISELIANGIKKCSDSEYGCAPYEESEISCWKAKFSTDNFRALDDMCQRNGKPWQPTVRIFERNETLLHFNNPPFKNTNPPYQMPIYKGPIFMDFNRIK